MSETNDRPGHSYCSVCGQHDGRHYPRLHKERDELLARIAGEKES